MNDYFHKRELFNSEREKYYQEKGNVRLKRAAIASISVAIILMLVAILTIEKISLQMLLFMRGLAGTLALVFVVLVAILMYRVNRSYFKDRNRPSRNCRGRV